MAPHHLDDRVGQLLRRRLVEPVLSPPRRWPAPVEAEPVEEDPGDVPCVDAPVLAQVDDRVELVEVDLVAFPAIPTDGSHLPH